MCALCLGVPLGRTGARFVGKPTTSTPRNSSERARGASRRDCEMAARRSNSRVHVQGRRNPLCLELESNEKERAREKPHFFRRPRKNTEVLVFLALSPSLRHGRIHVASQVLSVRISGSRTDDSPDAGSCCRHGSATSFNFADDVDIFFGVVIVVVVVERDLRPAGRSAPEDPGARGRAHAPVCCPRGEWNRER